MSFLRLVDQRSEWLRLFWTDSTLNSLVIRQKDESQNGCFKETKHAKFSKNEHFLPLVCVSGRINVRYSENLACFVFLKHLFWDSPFCLISFEYLMDYGIYAIRYYLSTELRMKCVVCSKVTVGIAQHYRSLCRHVFAVHFEKAIPKNI